MNFDNKVYFAMESLMHKITLMYADARKFRESGRFPIW